MQGGYGGGGNNYGGMGGMGGGNRQLYIANVCPPALMSTAPLYIRSNINCIHSFPTPRVGKI